MDMGVKVYSQFYDEPHDVWMDQYLIAEFCNKDWAEWFVKRNEKKMKSHNSRLVVEETAFTDEEYKAYEKVRRCIAINEAKDRVSAFLENFTFDNDFPDTFFDYDRIAENYLYWRDRNGYTSGNRMWEEVIFSYIDEKNHEQNI